MNEFEIELIDKETNSYGDEFYYSAKSENFEAEVTVFQREEMPFIHKHICKKGGEKLWHFRFWDDLQQSVLKYHKELEKERW